MLLYGQGVILPLNFQIKNLKMESLTKERMGEIAVSLLKEDTKKKPAPLEKDLYNYIAEASKNTGISKEELKSFLLEILEGIYNQTLNTLKELDFETLKEKTRVGGFSNYKKN
jgi:hypothetical protein